MFSILSFTKKDIGADQGEHVIRARQAFELGQLTNKAYNLAILSRTPSPELQKAVEAILQSPFQSLTKLINLHDDLEEQIAGSLQLFDSPFVHFLIDDMIKWCKCFASLSNTDLITLHLKSVVNDSCRKFHIDGYELRLLCTYAGPGTEWTYNNNVNRKELGKGENESIIKDWNRIERVNTFDIAVLKGEIPTRRNGKGIVHRSPPIEKSGEKRLLLRIDQ